MSDEPKEPGDPAAEAPQPDEEESPKLREVSQEELKDILAAHEKWVKSGGKEGKQADLPGANLQEVDLFQANLQKANLFQANLQEADLRSANLQGVNLVEANLQKANLFQANLQEAYLTDANLQGAILQGANLQGANLFEANLRKANFFEANLREANLIEANLRKANFFEANLQEAYLIEANLQEADFSMANLKDANLSHVKGLETAVLTDINLEGATGLLGSEFAGTDITGAKLPTDIAKFEGLDHVTEISKNARNIFLAVIGGCVFSWLTIAATTDVALLTNTASTPLPIIQTKVPIAGFYLAAPLILLSLYIYLHMYLQRLWSGLAGLPAIFPDGRTLDERAYPWLLTSLVGANVPRLKENRPPFSRQQVFISILTAWCLVPLTIGWFWLRYLPVHDWIGTGVHIALVALAVTHGVGYFWRAQVTLRGRQRPQFTWKIWRWRSPVPYAHAALALGLAAAALVISYGAINGVRSPAYTERRSLERIRIDTDHIRRA